MRLHDSERINYGNIRRPTNGDAWKDFDSLNNDFASDDRNIR